MTNISFSIETVWEISAQIRREEYRLAGLRDSIARITAPLDGLPRGNGYTSRVENFITLIAECEARLRDLYDDRLVARLNLLAVIRRAAGLSPPMERVLELRYCTCLQYEAIAAEMSYSLPHIYRLHREAKTILLQQFDEIVSSATTAAETSISPIAVDNLREVVPSY